MKTVVFDFDKTLTYKDSLTELFSERLNPFSGLFYYFLKLCSKLGLISVEAEKLFMIRILFRSDECLFSQACRDQGGKIRLTPVMETLKRHLAEGDRVIILSASPSCLLNTVFEGMPVDVLGAEFLAEHGKIVGFSRHPYGKKKLEVLSDSGIAELDDEYFDSPDDNCLMSISRHWHRVKDGKIVEQK